MHTYIMKHELNHQYSIFNEFMVRAGLRKDETIDAIVLIDGEIDENELEWVGLTQTMKKVFVKHLNQVEGSLKEAIEATKKETT